MDIRTIKKLIELVRETGISELEIRDDNDSVRISNQDATKKAVQEVVLKPAVAAASDASKTAEAEAETQKELAKKISGHKVEAPMVGTVYLAASPGAKLFVEEGSQVKKGDVICLIEAMKMFNRIEADKAGVIKKCYVKNGQPVEYGQVLYVIE